MNYLTPNFHFAPMMPARAEGSIVWDKQGKDYIDFAGGIAVNALGHCHPKLIDALTQQAHLYWHISNYYTTAPAQELARKLVTHSFADKVFFANSGAEANEAALKLARKHARDHYGADKNQIIACQQSFHGRTLFTVSVAGQPKYSQDFAPLPAGIAHIPFNDCHALEQTISHQTCAVIIEPIQGESGVLPASQEFLQTARKLCNHFQAALILDEVQTGMGRTGQLFAYQHHSITPDILTTAKALGNGIPIGAMLTTEHFAQSFTVGSHGSTFGGNPLACAVASTAFDLITHPDTMQNVQYQSQQLQHDLHQLNQQYALFQEIRGQGLLLGAVLKPNSPIQANQIVQAALTNGLMLLQAGDQVLRFAPSLLLTNQDRQTGIQRLHHTIAQLLATS